MAKKNRGFRSFMVLALSIAVILAVYMLSGQAISFPWEESGSSAADKQTDQTQGQAKDQTQGQEKDQTQGVTQDQAQEKSGETEQQPEPTLLEGAGRYEGQADSNFIEVTLVDDSGTESQRVFQLNDALKETFDGLKLQTGDSVRFTYEEREGQNPLLHSLKKSE